jgi:hypothetical protein
MEAWLAFRPIILDELVRRDGLQENASPPRCASCVEELGTYRCIDCTTPLLRCVSCIIHQHENLPLHRLEVCSSSGNNAVSPSGRSGTEGFLSANPSKISTTVSTSVINTPLARPQAQNLKFSSWLTSVEFTASMYNSVLVLGRRDGSRTIANSCV